MNVFNALAHVKIRNKLFRILACPLLGLLGFSASSVLEKNTVVNQMQSR